MFDAADIHLINEEFHAECVPAGILDLLLAEGWRHFGTHFFRYNFGVYEFDIKRVMPLRIRLKNFRPSKSQRRVLRKNRDLETIIRPAAVTPSARKLFTVHKQRFRAGVPRSIYNFVSPEPSSVPTTGMEVAVYRDAEPVAISYFDVGEKACSGVYAMFHPAESTRSLGIFTLLKEIEFAVESDMEFYYQGYTYFGRSFYDYKKRFHGSEVFGWNGRWNPLEDPAS